MSAKGNSMIITFKNRNPLKIDPIKKEHPKLNMDGNFLFSVPSKNGSNVNVYINYQEREIQAIKDYEITEENFKYIQEICKEGNKEFENYKETDLGKIIVELEESTQNVISQIKYWLRKYDIDDNHVFRACVSWSLDGKEWIQIPGTAYAWARGDFFETLNGETGKILQEHIDKGISPFLALKFLDRAINEKTPELKWINATIAAEMAIKEFLIKKDEKLESILLSLPSPPIHKLYGSILEEYAQVKSPKLKKIKEGSERRNKIIHSPNAERIYLKEAMDYVDDVDEAIYHLLTILYPNDQLIKHRFDWLQAQSDLKIKIDEISRTKKGTHSKKWK